MMVGLATDQRRNVFGGTYLHPHRVHHRHGPAQGLWQPVFGRHERGTLQDPAGSGVAHNSGQPKCAQNARVPKWQGRNRMLAFTSRPRVPLG